MSYQYLTQYNSPNFTPDAQARSVYGRSRTIEAIAIHWWGDPNENPQFEGIVNHLCSPAAQVSAHFVATGTGRRVACLVNLPDVSWATKQANPFTISIECDPRCRDEDYDVVAELIADLRRTYGNLPLVPHSQYVATRCPGNWDLGRLSALADNKISTGNFGETRNKVVLASAEQVQALYSELLERQADPGGLITYTAQTIDQARAGILASQEYHDLQQRKSEAEARAAAETAAIAAKAEADKAATEAAAQAAQVQPIPAPNVDPIPATPASAPAADVPKAPAKTRQSFAEWLILWIYNRFYKKG